MTKIERVLLVRHGQTDWNVSGRWQGTEPVPLNAEGLLQASALAQYVRGRPISAIYSSDLPRALQTAEAIGDAVGLKPQTDPRWREFHLGIFQGYTRLELESRFPDEWRAFQEDFWNYVVPGGESRRMCQERVYAAWQAFLAQDAGSEAVIVTHGGAIRFLLLKLFDNSPEIHEIHIENTSVTTLERNGDSWKLAGAAVISHL